MLTIKTYRYRDILKRAFYITKSNKILWFFGILAAFLSNLGVYNLLFGKINLLSTGEIPFIQRSLWLAQVFSVFSLGNLKFLLLNSPGTVVVLFVCLFMMIIAFLGILWIIVMSQITIIDSCAKIDKNPLAKKKALVDFSKIKNYFAPVLGLNIMAKLLTFFLMLCVAGFLVTILTEALVLNYVLYLFSFILFVILSLIISFVAIYSTCFIVLKNYSFNQALKSALKLFWKNWILSLEVAFILFIISALGSVVLLFAVFIASAPVILLLMVAFYMGAGLIYNLLFALLIIMILLIVLLFGGFLSAFSICSWVVLFDKIAQGKTKSKIERVYNQAVILAKEKNRINKRTIKKAKRKILNKK